MRIDKENKKRSMKERILAKAKQPRQSRFDYLLIPQGFEQFTFEGAKAKDIAGKKIVTKRLDIMPYVAGDGNPNCEKGELYYERTYFIHNVQLGPKSSLKFVCPNRTFGKPCPACEMLEKLRKDPRATKEEIANWVPKERQLFNVRDMDEPDKVKIWDISYAMFGKLLEAIILGEDDDDDFESFAELKGGKTLRIQFEEKKFGSGKYYETQKIDFKDRAEDYEDSAVDESANLDAIPILRSYDELTSLLFKDSEGEDDDTPFDGDDEEDGAPARRPSRRYEEQDEEPEEKPAKPVKAEKKPARKPEPEEQEEEPEKPVKPAKKAPAKKAEPEPEDDDDLDDDFDDFDDEIKSAKPAKQAKPEKKEPAKPAKKAEPEDDDDLDDDFDEEPEEKPAKAKAPVKKAEPAKAEKKAGKCPCGHKWGIDCDADHCADDCIECDLWDACSDAQEEMNS